ncbi:hypothetical protein BaRGS_00013216 [Batillaria attramentaria]|uniref:Glutathione S-transferase n=1 Tax=Batillaria attramentaria TaxID=370345 RepID=A0ABD0L7R4_9CAEN
MADIKLVYFDIRGRAEMLRLMFQASGTKYDEQRIQFGEEWAREKPRFYGSTNLDTLRIDEVTNLFDDQLRVIGRYRWLSLADFYLYDMTENLLWLKKDALQPFPLLQKLRQNVEADPKIKAYLATRKQTEY